MDPAIMAAIIGGVFTILAAGIPIAMKVREGRKERLQLRDHDQQEFYGISVGIVVRDHQFLLVQRRRREGNLSWQFPSGIIKQGEDPKDTVEREVRLETGIICRSERLIGTRVHSETNRMCHYYLCSYLDGEAQNGQPHENQEVRWVEAERVESYITSSIDPRVRKIVREVGVRSDA